MNLSVGTFKGKAYDINHKIIYKNRYLYDFTCVLNDPPLPPGLDSNILLPDTLIVKSNCNFELVNMKTQLQ